MDKPTVMKPVFSLDHHGLTRAERWFAGAVAYVQTAAFLFESMDMDTLTRDYFNARTAAYNFSQGVELFLKGAIASAGTHVDRTHGLEQLYRTYRNRFAAKVFAFTPEMEGFVTEDPSKPNVQFLRYPENDVGEEWDGNTHFDVTLWRYETERFAEQLSSLIDNVKQKTASPYQDQ